MHITLDMVRRTRITGIAECLNDCGSIADIRAELTYWDRRYGRYIVTDALMSSIYADAAQSSDIWDDRENIRTTLTWEDVARIIRSNV
jgi:hypothetical protein